MDDRYPSDGHQEEVYGLRVPAGKRTYFFDVKATRSGHDFFVTITESKRLAGEHEDQPPRYEKHKIFLYKEDFGKFVEGLLEAIEHVRAERLPEYDFSDVPRLAR